MFVTIPQFAQKACAVTPVADNESGALGGISPSV